MSAARVLPILNRLERAEQHLEELKGMLRDNFEFDLQVLTGQYDPQSKATTLQGQVRDLDVRIFAVVGDIVHELQSSLDHLAWQLVEENGGTPDENTRFPLAKTAPTANQRGVVPPPHVSGRVSQPALALMEAAQPYQLGVDYASHPLFVLRHLSNIDKHRHVAIQGRWLVDTTWTVSGPNASKFSWTGRTERWDEHGAEIVLVPDDPTVDVEGRTTLQVVVHEPGPGRGRPVFEVLPEAYEAVSKIVGEAIDTCFT